MIKWRSKRTARVVLSTLAAEAVASAGLAEFESHKCAFLGEALGGIKAIWAEPQPPCDRLSFSLRRIPFLST